MNTERQAEKIGGLIGKGLGEDSGAVYLEVSRQAVLQTMTELENGRQLPVRWMVAAAVLLVVPAVGLLWGRFLDPTPLSYHVAGIGDDVEQGEWIHTGERTTTPLVFENGSRFVLERATTARVTASDMDRVTIELSRGAVAADVVGNGHTEWRIDAGSYTVRVLGTRFTTEWQADASRLVVAVQAGRVAISGEAVRDGVVVEAGQRLVALETGVRIDSVASTLRETAPTPPRTADDRNGLPSKVRSEGSEASSRRERDDGAATSDDINTLWRRAESARRSGDAATADRFFAEIRARFPGTHRAATAAFLLGTSAFDIHRDPAAAEQWFARYISEAPRGYLAEEALGRRMEALAALGKRAAAAATATAYLARYPTGTFAISAKRIAEDP